MKKEKERTKKNIDIELLPGAREPLSVCPCHHFICAPSRSSSGFLYVLYVLVETKFYHAPRSQDCLYFLSSGLFRHCLYFTTLALLF